MKKIISIIITISMLLASVPAFAISGTGTESNPYLISSASDIAKIHDDLDGYYKLTNNINMSGIAFEPIGNETEGAFTGTIDGAGYTISNLNINLPENKYVGFVGYLEGTVKNLNLTNVDASGYRYVGGLVGYAEENSNVYNCSVSGNVKGVYHSFDLNVGGVVGYSLGIVDDLYNNCYVSSPSSTGGGIVGYNAGDILNSQNTGNVVGTVNGGIAGKNIKNIKNCSNNGYIDGKTTGGVCGENNSTIINCENYGVVEGYNYAGGICAENNGTIKDCVGYGNIEGGNAGGISRQNRGSIQKCINNGNIICSDDAGGIAVLNNGSIDNCINTGTIESAATVGCAVGGIAGNNGGERNGYIRSCFNSGKIIVITSSEYSIYVGGIAGENYDYMHTSQRGYISDSFNSGMVYAKGLVYSSGIVNCDSSSSKPVENSINVGIVKSYGKNNAERGYDNISNNYINSYHLGDISPHKDSKEATIYYDSIDDMTLSNYKFSEEKWCINDNINNGLPSLVDLPRHIDINKCIVVMNEGETEQLNAYIDNTKESVTWASDDTSIATVSSTGIVTPRSIGSCTITATNANGMKANCMVYVYRTASSMILSKSEINVNEGQSYGLTTIQNPTAANETVKWYSENEKVATVDQNGYVTAKARGTTKIYAITTQSNLRAECFVNVSAPIASITLSATSKSIKIGSSDIISATLSPSDYEGNITWSSLDESIATVDQNGKITAHKIGITYITATATSGITAQCTVTVTQPSISVTVNKPRITTYVNSTYQLSASMLPLDTTDTITWSSSSTTYATVSSTGLVTGKRVGTATITARTSSGLTATCYVTVKSTPIEPTSLTLSDTYITLAPEDAKALTATMLPSNATETTLIWTSSNDDVAAVDKNGVITAVGEGFATIKAKTTNGLSHECVVKVVSASGPSVIVDNVKSFPAGIAKAKVNIIRNPGISGYKFTINYDDTLLTPVSVTANEEFGGTLTTNLDDENRTEFNVVWYSNSDTDIDINGELFTIDFKVAETAKLGDYSDISIEYGAKDICNTAGENIALYTESSKVTVEEPLPGDIYEDGDVNIYDLTLLARHMIGLADFTDRQMEAANVTDDDLVDIKDVVKLAQYVVGWTGIELMSLMSLNTDVPETPTVTIGTASVNDANEADIPVYIKNNPGVAAYRFVLDYDADDIEIVSIAPSEFINPENFGTNLGQENDEGLIVFCYQEGNAVADGELFTVKVRYKNPTDTSISPISIKSAENNFCNQTIENVAVNYETGYVLGDDYITTNKAVGDTNFSCELYFDNSYEEQSAKAIIAFYDGDGRMVQLMPKDITVKPGKVDLSIDYDKKAYATYKLMIWEDMNSLKPITAVK